jgi:hypothetical protein
MPTFTVVPLHRMIVDALKQLRDARSDGAPDHNPQTCYAVCRICSNQRQLDRLIDKIPRKGS